MFGRVVAIVEQARFSRRGTKGISGHGPSLARAGPPVSAAVAWTPPPEGFVLPSYAALEGAQSEGGRKMVVNRFLCSVREKSGMRGTIRRCTSSCSSLHVCPPATPTSPKRPDDTDTDTDTLPVDDSGGTVVRVDEDRDGYDDTVDCDDNAYQVYPGAPELLCDGEDNDCDALVDEDFDVDADGAFAIGGCESGTDCDDADATIAPGAAEVPYDGVDQDCDGMDARPERRRRRVRRRRRRVRLRRR